MVSECHLCAREGHIRGPALGCSPLENGTDTASLLVNRWVNAPVRLTDGAHSHWLGWGDEATEAPAPSGFSCVCLSHALLKKGL